MRLDSALAPTSSQSFRLFRCGCLDPYLSLRSSTFALKSSQLALQCAMSRGVVGPRADCVGIADDADVGVGFDVAAPGFVEDCPEVSSAVGWLELLV